MIDIAVYRFRIGCFNPKIRSKKIIYSSEGVYSSRAGKTFKKNMKTISKLFLILCLILSLTFHLKYLHLPGDAMVLTPPVYDADFGPVHAVALLPKAVQLQAGLGFLPMNKKLSPNFKAR